MFCIRCGKQIMDDMKFCPYCGAPVYTPQQGEAAHGEHSTIDLLQEPPEPQTDERQDANATHRVVMDEPVAPVQAHDVTPMPVRTGLATAIVFTVLALLTFNVLALITGIIAIVFAALASSGKKTGDVLRVKSQARTAKALNVTTIILVVIGIALIVTLVALTVHAVNGLQMNGLWQQELARELEELMHEYGYRYDRELIEQYLRQGGAAHFVQAAL